MRIFFLFWQRLIETLSQSVFVLYGEIAAVYADEGFRPWRNPPQ
jgi:hypothetical protein